MANRDPKDGKGGKEPTTALVKGENTELEAPAQGAVTASVPAEPFDPNARSWNDAEAAFLLRGEEIQNVPDSKAKVINTDIGTAVQGVFGTVKNLWPLVDMLASQSPEFQLKTHLERMYTVALSLNYLQAKYRIVVNTTDTEQVVYLRRMRRLFQLDAETLALRGYLNLAQVEELKHTNNHHALSYDVMGLSGLISSVYDQPGVRIMTTKEELAEAAARANELFAQLGARQFGPNAGQELKILRRKAFALMIDLFVELQAFLVYARRKQGDAASFLGSLYKRGRKSSSSKGSDGVSAADDVDDASDASDLGDDADDPDLDLPDIETINRNVAAASAAAGINPEARPGFPGSSPFGPEDNSSKP